jgi:NAD(P)H dehydrogenase (quinone)
MGVGEQLFQAMEPGENIMILITGAGGKTGRAVLSALISRGIPARGLAHTPEQAQNLIRLGAAEALSGDLSDTSLLKRAVIGVEKIYHICPNVSPDEESIGSALIGAAIEAGTRHFVYHSVLHPQVEAMPHHWQKMRVEEALFSSSLNFSIMQPCAYMQNILSGWNDILAKGVYTVPYSAEARISVVDLRDVAEAAAAVLQDDLYLNAILECAGPQPLTQVEVADVIAEVTGSPIIAEKQDPRIWESKARQSGMSPYQVDTLLKMFNYYDKNGFVGNSHVLENVIQKRPQTLKEFLTWYNQKPTEE